VSEKNFEGPPQVVVDEQGLGAGWAGQVKYHILWTELRTVTVDVIGGYEAYWILDGENPVPGEPLFVSPVEVVAGAEELRAKLLDLPGFDLEAFAAALDAEERGQEAEFICWRA
jgi:hypothetical protein